MFSKCLSTVSSYKLNWFVQWKKIHWVTHCNYVSDGIGAEDIIRGNMKNGISGTLNELMNFAENSVKKCFCCKTAIHLNLKASWECKMNGNSLEWLVWPHLLNNSITPHSNILYHTSLRIQIHQDETLQEVINSYSSIWVIVPLALIDWYHGQFRPLLSIHPPMHMWSLSSLFSYSYPTHFLVVKVTRLTEETCRWYELW